MKTIRQIAFRGREVIIYYSYDRFGPGGNDPSRQIKTLSKIISLEKLEVQGVIDMEKLEELL